MSCPFKELFACHSEAFSKCPFASIMQRAQVMNGSKNAETNDSNNTTSSSKHSDEYDPNLCLHDPEGLKKLQTFNVSENTREVLDFTVNVVRGDLNHAGGGQRLGMLFYNNLLLNYAPGLNNVFNQGSFKSHSQATLLIKSVVEAAECARDKRPYSDETMDKICQRHAALGVIDGDAYKIVKDVLTQSIIHGLPSGDHPEILKSWRELYDCMRNLFLSREINLKREASLKPGGWYGKRKFILSRKIELTPTISSFTFRPIDGLPISNVEVGQYTTLWLKIEKPYAFEQPRHYTLVKTPNEDKEYTIIVKSDPKGVVSQQIHKLKPGIDQVDLSPPFGSIHLDKFLISDKKTVVLCGAGSGITATLSLLERTEFGKKGKRIIWLYSAKDLSESKWQVERVAEQIQNLKNKGRISEGLRFEWLTQETEKKGVGATTLLNLLPMMEGNNKDDKDDKVAIHNAAPFHFNGRMNLNDLPENIKKDMEGAFFYVCGPPNWMSTTIDSINTSYNPTMVITEGYGVDATVNGDTK